MKRSFFSFFSSFVFAFALLTGRAATARAAETAEPTPDDGGAHLSGLEIMVRPTLGGAGAASPIVASPSARTASGVPSILSGATPYGASLGAGAQLGFRFHPLVSAGLRGDFGTVSASAPSDGTKELSRSWQSAGLYVRAYPLALSPSVRRWVDPWIAAGITYMHDGQRFGLPAKTSAGTTVDAEWQLDSHAIGVPLAVGLDYRVTPALSVGPSFEWILTSPIAGCAKQSAAGFQANRLCTDNEGPNALVADAAFAWNVGLGIKLTPFSGR